MDGPKTTHDLAIIGPLPPPHGGVAVHVERLLGHLDQADVDYIMYDISAESTPSERVRPIGHRGWRWFVGYLLRGREPVVYVHTSRWDVWAATWWLSRVRGKSVIIAVHTDSLRRLWPIRSRRAKRRVVRAFRAARTLVAASPHVRDFLDQIAEVGHKTVVIPAFVEPVVRAEDEASINPAVRSFCESHEPVLLASGAPIVYDDGRDLYGIDMTLELVDRLRERFPRMGLVWSLLEFQGSKPEYAEHIRQEARRRGLNEHWLFSAPQEVFYPMYRLADLLVRPTVSDGDAISVREALHFGVPAVASDAAPRPPGTIVFASRDLDDFVAKVEATLESLDDERTKLADLPRGSAVAEEVDLLRRAIQETHDT